MSFKDSFELFELPDIIASIVDYLQPLLSPYEAAIYWYMFRHSVIQQGDVYVRVSTRGLAKPFTVISSVYKGRSANGGLSYAGVQTALNTLETKNVIQKSSDTNRKGTIYRIYLPDEIDICKERMRKFQLDDIPEIDPKKELDFYNIKENRLKIFERDGFVCYKCGKQLTRFSATLDHVEPISEGGDNSYDNLITCCLHCNSRKGARPVSDTF